MAFVVFWHVVDELDLRTMQAAADALLGEHDFRAFCRRVPGTSVDEPIHRRVIDARWGAQGRSPGPGPDRGPGRASEGTEGAWPVAPPGLVPEVGRLLTFEIEANAFCHQMVRSLVGSLVEVGRGKENAAGLMERLRAVSRHRMPDPAPALGLCLVSVTY